MAVALAALVYLFAALLLMRLAERYIPDGVMDKLERLLGFTEGVREDE